MSQPWFRFYHEALDDPKVQKLTGDAFKFWVNCLCLAKRNEGKLPDLAAISFAFRMELIVVEKFMEIMHMAGLIDTKASWKEPHNWKKRQPKSDSSTERVKRHRKRRSNVSSTVTDTLENQIRTDTDTEQKRGDREAPVQKRRRPTPAPNALEISVEMLAWAAQNRITVSLALETERMLDYFRGTGKPKADWVATWRNWMLKAMEINVKSGGNHVPRETENDKNNRAVKDFINRSMAPKVCTDIPDVRQEPIGLPGSVRLLPGRASGLD